MKPYLCIDIGGTAIKHGLFSEDFKCMAKKKVPTHSAAGPEPGVLEQVFTIIKDWQAQTEVEGIAISTTGIVDPKAGQIIYASEVMPGYTGTKLKAPVENAFNLPCIVENDVNCMGLAEANLGAGRSAQSCLCITVGTGIGGSFICGGEIFHGFSNSACEVGYLRVPGGVYQDLASTSQLVKKIAEGRGISPSSINGFQIFEEARAGAKDCIIAIDEMVDILADGLANIVYLLNPEMVILGGGIMEQRDYMEPRIQSALSKRIIPVVFDQTQIALAQHGNDAGMLGALMVLLRQLKESSEG
ncbi:Sugar kinase of the NBD/HSP70 family, may contain an N-terminal HTH domain [Eubacterium aggregans]|uniref:Sugar kinase of the NBD/HSP70 family, may contain an N-terminal HTH domain n=1 Tax=Eubacterium aggregans TaxID=81409 RepID=A0A1H3ZCW9_9FIRM|nr:ROK family protein [Eubacterium aggregans]SEA21224.1 Sugar kinase of the NBD/HSP70 family, may contain an N-terminal HTH domain [Eubacterium aggregans]